MTQPAGPPRRPHQSARTKARKRALDILFESDLRGTDPIATLAAHSAQGDQPVREFTAEIVRGVAAHLGEIDQRIAECLTSDWTLERMPRVDRNLARIAVYELDHGSVAAEIAVSEAVGLAGELSTDDSPVFLNGVLGRAAQTIQRDAD